MRFSPLEFLSAEKTTRRDRKRAERGARATTVVFLLGAETYA
jgi:hypothetical protein